jgi:uncharacterized membrane protein
VGDDDGRRASQGCNGQATPFSQERNVTMSSQNYEEAPEMTAWVGWSIFAASMMIIGGSLNAMYGLVAVVNDDWVVWTNRNSAYLDLTSWGWVHIVVGVLVAIAGVGVLSGNVLARTVGVFLAGVSLIANFLFLPVYPIWSLIVITLDVLVIWALTAHGRELRAS